MLASGSCACSATSTAKPDQLLQACIPASSVGPVRQPDAIACTEAPALSCWAFLPRAALMLLPLKDV
jgi:hypothetical protein